MTTAHEIVTLIRQQNWKNGGCLLVDHDEAVALIEQYAAVVAAGAATRATAAAYDACLSKLKVPA